MRRHEGLYMAVQWRWKGGWNNFRNSLFKFFPPDFFFIKYLVCVYVLRATAANQRLDMREGC
jgi:hypothetical protein